MARIIHEVDFTVVDANGAFTHATSYPKKFDSDTYNGDIDGTMKRAKAEYFNTLGGAYGNQAGRQIQTVILKNVFGEVLLRESIGGFPTEEVEPEPEPTPEPEEEQ